MGLLASSVTLFVLSFLLGSIPWGVIISRVFFHTDVREHGSGNIGTTNAMRTMGKAGGIAVFVLDFGKGILSGVLAWLVFAQLLDPAAATASARDVLSGTAFLGCIWGHIFSPWLKFKGGKGIAVAVGCMFVAFGPLIACIELALFVVVVAVSRHVSAGSVAAAVLCPFMALWRFWNTPVAFVMCTAAALTVVWAHRSNIKRLREGTESRIGVKEKDAR
jgi:glycerol-3-phosphate acyltransferase PlsY